MAWLFDKLVPWYVKLAIIAAILVGLWGAWVGFVVYVSEPRVKAAVEDNNLLWADKFNHNTSDLKTLGQQFIDQGAAFKARMTAITDNSNAKFQKEKDRANTAELRWKAELQAQKRLVIERDALVASNAELRKRLPDLARPIAGRDGDSEQVRSLRDFADGLGGILERCQQTVSNLRRGAAAAVDRLGESEATARALKPVD